MAAEQKKGRRTRLDDIAARCGVSISTVSRALAGEKGVRPEIRKLVLETASAVSYALPASVAGKKVMLVASGAAMKLAVNAIVYGLKQIAQRVHDGADR